MNRNLKIYLFFLAAVIAFLTVLEVNKKPLVDWRKSFDLDSKAPFGLYVFKQEADKLFDKKLKRIPESPYDFYSKDSLQKPHNILVITENYNMEVTKNSWKKIMKQVQAGSNLMLISSAKPYFIQDSIDLSINYYNFTSNQAPVLSFTDPKRKSQLKEDKLPADVAILGVGELNVRFLGKVADDSNPPNFMSNFLVFNSGKGKVFYHIDPLFLTNYYLLKDQNYRYAEDVFSYLDNTKETYWFVPSEAHESQSPLRFILSNPPLKYAWYILITGLLVFIFFNAKRRQRIVPVIKPLRNTSVEFVRSIGNLYLNEGTAKDMMKKKTTYFLNKVRTDLLLDTTELDAVFAERLRIKTGVSETLIAKGISLMKKALNENALCSEEDLIQLNETLDKIFK